MFTKAVFLDKDGTLLENVPYNVDPEKIRLAEGVEIGLQQLHAAGFQLHIMTNQAGVAYGRFPEEALRSVEERIQQIFSNLGVPLSGFYYCPHHPDGRVLRYRVHCFCRKPNPGLLFRAAREHEINLAASWFIGDILNDVEAGRRADCRTVLINNGNETEWNLSGLRMPHYTVGNFQEAAQAILSSEGMEVPSPKKAIPVHIPRSESLKSNLHASL